MCVKGSTGESIFTAQYKAAFSISSLPAALAEAFVGGLVIAVCVSFFLLRFFDRIPGKKAIICPIYGSPDVLQLREVMKPVAQEDEVLIQIHAASLNSRDLRMLRANPFFMRLMPGGFLGPKNKILGADLAGRVEAIGCNVRQLKPGDEVFEFLPSATGHGTFAEFVCAEEKLITLKPANLSFEQTARDENEKRTGLPVLRERKG